MRSDGDSSYSRLPAEMSAGLPKSTPKPTRGQKAMEVTLFAVFGLTIALAGVALYATNRPEHNRIPNRVESGLQADRVNILLIGASLRTGTSSTTSNIKPESLMLLSVQPSTGRTALASIPVDLWVKVGRYGRRPLRAAYALGDSSGYPGAGTGLMIDTVEQIIDEPIHGYARLSIGDVSRVVDSLGGVQVDVKRGVYEVRGDRHRFRRGHQRLNGTAAMHYAFSGAVAGFAADPLEREQRQREVFVAGLNRILHSDASLDDLAEALGPVAATNLRAEHIQMLAKAAQRTEAIRVVTFKPYLDTVAISSVAYRGEAVSPRSGDFVTLRKLTDAVFDTGVIRIH